MRSLKSNESHSIGVVFDYKDQDLVALAALIFDSFFLSRMFTNSFSQAVGSTPDLEEQRIFQSVDSQMEPR